MKTKHVLLTVLISAITTFAVIFTFNKIDHNRNNPNFQSTLPANYKYAGFLDSGNSPMGGPVDFTQAAAAAIPTVVHIKTLTNAKTVNNNLPQQQNPFSDLFGDDLFNQLFGQGQRQRMLPEKASGSGVIISDDGYIVTNNHVVAGSDKVTVTMSNRKTYTAKVIAADPSYDLAVIKIDANNLPFMLYGNSSDTKIGQWVLAIGYPLYLDATVTAGIISAKSRWLGLNHDKSGGQQLAVESFLQTDAAVNPGNSGGALINTSGQMIGINAAIASPTGYYSGYSYAIPVDIVKKVVNDLIKYGSVQRGFLGAAFLDAGRLTDQQKKQANVPENVDGVYITDVVANGAAKEAGIKPGDVIEKINGVTINSGSELQEQLSNFRPGDKVDVTVSRDGSEKTMKVTLKNNAGTYSIVKAAPMVDKLGAELETLDPQKAKQLGLPGGVVVKKINDGVLNDQTRMRDGFIITKVNGKDVKSLDDLKKEIGNQTDITISGYYPGYNEPFEYPLSMNNSPE
ncbi:PDZ domain-containing protein [Hanamia caeni]|jgi:Do/DeqQ family serine protease|uniref:PDZ domain-containing protein n=1 Tax=Hanamia caeni TaxID=2294116 RepID=A0A3M9NPX8_9BACT|nr:trypsin-like peptidase domain-containing protein [Hanamia caeni]RNI39088.1 PDZ domain-containing protein [Hanamia caeni]